MIGKIKQFFEHQLAPGSGGMVSDPEHAIQLAVAVLLYEVAESDYEQRPEERNALLDAVKETFNLTEKESAELLSLAEAEHADSTDYFQFTRLINEHYTAEQKIELVEKLWLIAYSDQQLHHYEEHVIRRLAELLHVPHSAFMATKHRVQGKD